MTHRPTLLPLALAALMTINAATLVRASGDDEPFPHIRPTDARVRALVKDATQLSPTVRSLIERISASDVVVYISCERDLHVRPAGRLNFITAAGGVRYVLIRIKLQHRRNATIALLAHELQHAAEIAGATAIVDEASMAREYARMSGRRSFNGTGVTFDTRAAVDVGDRVLEEISAGVQTAD